MKSSGTESRRSGARVVILASFVAAGQMMAPTRVSAAIVEKIMTSADDALVPGRSVFDAKTETKPSGHARALFDLKQAILKRDYASCPSSATRARAAAASLRAWIAVVEMECATAALRDALNVVPTSSKKGAKPAPKNDLANALAKVLQRTESEKDWFFQGAQAQVLRRVWIDSRLALLAHDVDHERSRADEGVSKLEPFVEWLDQKQRALLWRFAGETEAGHRRLEGARELFRRSLAIEENPETRSKLTTVEQALRVPSLKPAEPPPPPSGDIEASREELELVTRISNALKAGDLGSAVEDAVKLIGDFPGGTRAKWAADRAQEAYLSLADKGDERLVLARERLLKSMEANKDADRTAEWARVAFNRGQYKDSLRLGRSALKTMSDSARATKVLLLAGEAAVHVEDYDGARDIFKTLIERHAGTAAAREAQLRLGLVEVRAGTPVSAIAALERVLTLPQIDNFELTARYWLWRSLQKSGDGARAKDQADIIAQKFPFSYYGLRARAELNGGKIEWSPPPVSRPIEAELWLTKRERSAWENARTLIEAGWFDEAQAEIARLPSPATPAEKALRSRLLAAAFSFPAAIKMVNEAWDADPQLRRQPFVSVSFPREFATSIQANAASRKVEPSLIMGLIKQESSYDPRAVSPSQAMGLMQLVPATAREVAQDLKMSPLVLPEDLWDPQRNIRLGSAYLARLIKKYEGHVPLALAAYNAGQGKVDRWLRSRPKLSGLAQVRTSSPENELWFDELPWSETSYYVKAILRNLLLYRVLDRGRVESREPLWAPETSSPQ